MGSDMAIILLFQDKCSESRRFSGLKPHFRGEIIIVRDNARFQSDFLLTGKGCRQDNDFFVPILLHGKAYSESCFKERTAYYGVTFLLTGI